MEFGDLKFLVVDDSKLMRRQIEKTLQSLNAGKIIQAGDGSAALEALNEHVEEGDPIGFIISDVNMPTMNGLELLKEVKNDPRFAGIPFVFVTAEGLEDEEDAAKQADAVLRKPVTAEGLTEALQNYLAKNAA